MSPFHAFSDTLRVIPIPSAHAQGPASHLIITPRITALINCHLPSGEYFTQLKLPRPSLLLATHIDAPISRQGEAFPDVPCLVPRGLLPMALNPAAVLAEAITIWDQTQNWERVLGQETWGVAGSRKYDPPATAIPMAQPVDDGQIIPLSDDTHLKAFSLPFYGPHSLGYELVHRGQRQAVFSGGAIQAPGKLTQIFAYEFSYSFIRFKAAIKTLEILAALPCDILFPSVGPALRDPAPAIQNLISDITAFEKASVRRPEWFTSEPHEDGPEISGYHQRAPGVFQNKKYGNTIILIDDQGNGLIVDPGPCGFEDPNRIDAFHKNLDGLHQHAGLRNIDTTLITHFHGDHVDLAGEIKRRYPGARTCAWAPVAQIIQNPHAYPYACLLPWYGLPHTTTPVDHAISKNNPFSWHGKPITPIYTPGHAKAHAAYLIDFAGQRIAFTGDSIQTNGELAHIQCIPCNDSVLGGDSSVDIAYRNLLGRGITLNLGGHGSWFTNCDYHYKAALERIEGALPALRKLFPEDLQSAFRPRWFPALDVDA